MKPWEFANHGEVPCATSAPDLWFPVSTLTIEEKQAITICQGCQFRVPCLQYALEHDVSGIWGGLTENKRVLLRKKLGIKAQQMAMRNFVPLQTDRK